MKIHRNPLRSLLIASALAIFATPSILFSQSPAAAEASNNAFNLFSAGNYQDAATAYEQLLRDYPTDALVPGAQVQLGFAYYFLGRFDDAINIIRKAISGPALPSELKQSADGLLPLVLSAKAAAMSPDEPNRKSLFEEAIKNFGDYIKNYPNADDLENILYSRAIANFQIGKLEETIKDAETAIQRFPQSPTIATTKNLLAITLATLGSQMLAADPKNVEALTLYDRAIEILRDIIINKKDIALYNESNFQLGEILFNKATFSPEDKKPALFADALQAYRNVLPKSEILKYQEELIASFPEKRRAAIQSRNQALLKQLERDIVRELTKFEALKNKPDPTASAMLKMSEIYFQKGDYNSARTLLRHIAPFLQQAPDQTRQLYLLTMTYALQGLTEQAVKNYNEFVSRYKGDPVADNLPLAIGNLFLSQGKPAEAIPYFQESLTTYPNGRFASLSVVSKASAEAALGKYDLAAQTFRDFLAKNPPPEVGVIAQIGLANIFKDTGKFQDAIPAYKTVKEKFPDTPQAIEAEYWIAICTQQKGDNAAAIPLLASFHQNHPEHPLAPLALYAKGAAHLAINQTKEGLETLASVAEKYPQSQPAPFTYFMRAQIHGAAGETQQVLDLMSAFIEKYPQDDKVFSAFETIAMSHLNMGKMADAQAAYLNFLEKYPQSPQAPEALLRLADLQLKAAEGLGRYGALNSEERNQWTQSINSSIASAERLLKEYPQSSQLSLALRTLINIQRLMVSAGLKKSEEAETYFNNLANSAPSAEAKSKVLFTLADFIASADPTKALEIMKSAFKPEIIYSPADLDNFGLALLKQGSLDEALQVFQKLEKDYPIPSGVSPNQAPPLVQEAQAIALFGIASVAQKQGKTSEAGQLFEQLKQLYPWSPKVLEANYGIAEALRAENKFDEAMSLLGSIIRAPTATAELRANSMLMFGHIMAAKSANASDEKQKRQFLDSAIDNFIKIAQFYGGVPQAASEGLWQGARLLEEQAKLANDPAFKRQQLGRAKTFYTQLVESYPESPFVAQAKERLSALPQQ